MCILNIFPCPTNCTVDLTKAMAAVEQRLFREGVRYYRVGVGLIDLISEQYSQIDLFNPPKANPAMMLVLDKINERYGRDTILVAAQGGDYKSAMRRDFLTPQYTTSWTSLPYIKC
jgi:DNA polymerase V